LVASSPAARRIDNTWNLGLEYYADFGAVGRAATQSHTLFAVTDFKLGIFNVDLGLGYGLTQASDRLVVKTIIGYAFPAPGGEPDARERAPTTPVNPMSRSALRTTFYQLPRGSAGFRKDYMQERVAPSATGHDISLGEAVRVWIKISLLSFGGPAGQIAVMHRILVDEKKWISEARFLHALNYCMLLPGPEAQQLATYIGWLLHRIPGGIIAGGLFILPGVISIMALSYIYAAYGNTGYVNAVFYGLKTAVLAIVIQAVMRIGKRALRNNAMLAIAAGAFIAIFFFNVPFPVIIVAAGVAGYLGATLKWSAFASSAGLTHASTGAVDRMLDAAMPDHVRPNTGRALRVGAVWLLLWLAPVAALLAIYGGANVFSQIAVFFSKMAMVTFGGAYAVLAYVAQQAVEHYHWVTPHEMLDGLGMAETTPGPLVMVLQFVGFLAAYRDPGSLSPALAGTLGGLLATWVTFTPCFLWIFLGAPFIEQMRDSKALAGALSAITAAVVGVILNLSIWFATHTIFREAMPIRNWGLSFDMPVLASLDAVALVLSIAAAVAVLRFNVGMFTVLGGACAAGLLLRAGGVI
jgi:chromate transporter